MNNPLDSIKGTIISGVILSIIVIYALASSPASIYNGILRAIHASYMAQPTKGFRYEKSN